VTALERDWAACVFDTIFPSQASPRDIEALVEGLPASAAAAFRAALAAVTLSPVVLERRPRLLSGLDRDGRLRVLETFARSDVYLARSVFTLLKATAAMACARTSKVLR
jgi:hypothetical protein